VNVSSAPPQADTVQILADLDAGVPAVAAASKRVPTLVAYLRSQVVAASATLVDFVVMVACVELLGVYYVAATAVGAAAGGVTAFAANRHWSFLAGHGVLSRQAARYLAVWVGSLGLNCLLVYLLTDHGDLPYRWSKAATAVLVGACFNFPLHRLYVFR
jgi:putative flippase GtrA